MTEKKANNLMQGALEMLILKTLIVEDRHGWGIAKRLKQISSDVFTIKVGSLYPALYRLEKKGMVECYTGTSDKGRDAKFYRILPKGRVRLEGETQSWHQFSAAVEAVLKSEG